MTAIILLAIIGFWITAATLFAVTASMMSARISRMEESGSPLVGNDPEIAPSLPLTQRQRLHTQPRASSIN